MLEQPFQRLRPAGATAVAILLAIVNGSVVHRTAFERPWLSLLCLAAGLALAHPRAARVWLPAFRRLYALPTRGFHAGLFTLGLAANLFIVWECYHGTPRLDDGVAALFQARLFASGAITLPLPENPGFFEVFGVLGEKAGLGHWAGMYPPGWPALLTVGVWPGVPWLVNPILGACLALAVCALGREFFGEAVGRTAGLLTVFSPICLSLAGTFLSHTPTALFSALCFLYAHRLVRTGRLHFGLLAGAAWSAAFLCRPLTALVVGAAIAVGLLFTPKRVLKAWPGILAALALAAVGVLTLMAFQVAVTGDPFTPGHKIGMGARGKFGYGVLDAVRTHTLELGLRYTRWRFQALNADLLGWALPAFLFALAPFLFRRATRDHLLLLLPYPLLLFTFNFYWYYESYFEARYSFASVPMLLAVAAHGIHTLVAPVERYTAPARARGLRRAIPAVCVLFLGAVALPVHFARFDARFGDVEGILPHVIAAHGITNAVVFVDAVGVAPEEEDPRNNYYATGFMRNDLDLEQPVIFARNSREQNIAILDSHPRDAYYLYRYERGVNKAMLFRLVPEDGIFTAVPMEPRGKHMIPAAPVASPSQ